MTSVAALHTGLVDLLTSTLTTVTVFNGTVPANPPTDPATGRVYPYVVVWGAPGYTPEQARNLEGDADGALEWPVQVTVAAGDITWCMQATHLVRTALEGAVVTPGAGPLREEPGSPGVQPDRDTTPARFYVPLLFRSLNP